jgi:hypothetical protein
MGHAQAAETTISDKAVADKIDLIMSLTPLLHRRAASIVL